MISTGDGKLRGWYDPALGRPLQPNAAGGPPTLPQALNRYAAATLGQPGVYAAAQSNPFAIAFGHQIPGTALGVAIDLAPASRLVEKQLWGLIEHSSLPTRGLAGALSRFTTSGIGRSLTRLPFGWGEKVAARYASRYQTQLIRTRLDQGGTIVDDLLVDDLLAGGGVVSSRYYNARLLRQWEVPIIERGTYGAFYPWKTIFKSAGVAGVISGGFQLYDDWDNPYLTPMQKVYRGSISGGIGFGATLAGGWVGAKVGAALGTGVAPGGGQQ